MTKAKHTPGHWVLHEGKTAVNGADGHLVASCGSLPYRNKWDEEANARLIAAAPELLDALDEFVNGPFPSGDGDVDRLFAKARAAIAKARGQA